MNTGPNMLRYINATVGRLVDAGFSYPQADHAWNAVDNHLYGFMIQEQHFPVQPEDYARIAGNIYLYRVPCLPHLSEMTKMVARGHFFMMVVMILILV